MLSLSWMLSLRQVRPYNAAQGWEEMAAAWRSPFSATILAAMAVLSQGMTRTPLRLFRNLLHWPMACSWE